MGTLTPDSQFCRSRNCAGDALGQRSITLSRPLSARGRWSSWLIGADDLEVLVDEDVVRPVDADVVDLVLAVARLHNTIDDAARVGGQCGLRGLIPPWFR